MPRPFHIAVLDCDEVVPPVAATHGDHYSDIFIPLMRSAATRANCPFPIEYSAWRVKHGHYPEPNSIDAIMVTGSIAAAYDQDEWVATLGQFIERIYLDHPHVKIFGSCFGHQLIGHVLLRQYGVKAVLNPAGRQIGIRSIVVDPSVSEHFVDATRGLKSLRLQVIHGDHVMVPENGLPDGWYSLGRSDCCAVHGLFQPGRVLTLQGHFEFNPYLSRQFVEYFFTEERGWSREWLNAAYQSIESGEDDAEIAADLLHAFFVRGWPGPVGVEEHRSEPQTQPCSLDAVVTLPLADRDVVLAN